MLQPVHHQYLNEPNRARHLQPTKRPQMSLFQRHSEQAERPIPLHRSLGVQIGQMNVLLMNSADTARLYLHRHPLITMGHRLM